jgi:hypothetical protein
MKIIGIFLQKKSCPLIHRKLDRDITKILLKAALNTIIPLHYNDTNIKIATSIENLNTLYPVQGVYKARQKSNNGRLLPFETIDKSIYKKQSNCVCFITYRPFYTGNVDWLICYTFINNLLFIFISLSISSCTTLHHLEYCVWDHFILC